MNRIKLLGVVRRGRCSICDARDKAVRIAVPDVHHGVLGWTMCQACLSKFLEIAKSQKLK